MAIRRQCELLGLVRSSWYYEPDAEESEENLHLMRRIDELYMDRPFYGYPRMTRWLKELGWAVNEKRVARLMQVMGLQATLPGPHTSKPHPQHEIYPYLLRGLQIKAPREPVASATLATGGWGIVFVLLVERVEWRARSRNASRTAMRRCSSAVGNGDARPRRGAPKGQGQSRSPRRKSFHDAPLFTRHKQGRRPSSPLASSTPGTFGGGRSDTCRSA